jgi:hypothetical protein
MVDMPPAIELMTVRVPHGVPTLAEAAKQLGVPTENMDTIFGVVPVDPKGGVYAVQVRVPAEKLKQQPEGPATDYRGPWSNPGIAPFGPVQEGKPGDDPNRR